MTDVFIELAGFAAVLFVGGLFAGVLAGLFGVGGGIVMVPLLTQVFTWVDVAPDQVLHLAVGTSLAMIVPTSIRSFLGHQRKGAVDLDVLIAWAPALLVGVLWGGLTAFYVPGSILALTFAIAALFMAYYLGFGKDRWRFGTAVPTRGAGLAWPSGIGFVSTLMGVGGGVFGVTVMSLYGAAIHRAVGTASGLGLLISVPASLAFALGGLVQAPQGLPPLSLGFVNLPALACIIAATWLATPLGVRLAHGMSAPLLAKVYASYLVIAAARMAVEAF
ncbi:MAG: sulfite exporter TauE/SafE family protein [Pseudomonadota bacterium]